MFLNEDERLSVFYGPQIKSAAKVIFDMEAEGYEFLYGQKENDNSVSLGPNSFCKF